MNRVDGKLVNKFAVDDFFRRLNERYAEFDQVGFMTTQRVDGKLILPEAVKVLVMGNSANG